MADYPEMRGKVAFISGAGSENGIGFAIATKLASNGANICMTDIQPCLEELERSAEKIRKAHGVEVLTLALDVMSEESVNAVIQPVLDRFKGIDILVNNAGTAFGMPSTVEDYDSKAFEDTVDVNLHGVFRMCKLFAPSLKERKGAIINLSSTAGKAPHAYGSAYACAKTAVIMLTKVMAVEVGMSGVRVNAVCPGLILTDLQRKRFEVEAQVHGGSLEDQEKRLASSVPLEQRLGSPSEVASVVAFLASDEASYVTGQALNICGGRTMAA